MIENDMGMTLTKSGNVTAVQQGSGFNQTLVTIQWNGAKSATHYIVEISPEVQSGSTFNTTTNSYQLSILNDQEYIISVTASNCAGNSTAATIVWTRFTGTYCCSSTRGL